MIYRDNDIPQEYNKLAEISDNYVVWVREGSLSSGTKYNAYIQFLRPSISVTFTDDYMISTGTDYRLDAHYNNSGVYSFIDYYDLDFSRTTVEVDSSDISSELYDRPDMPEIFICQFICVVIFVWMLNQLSKLVHKGGVFGG